MSERAKRINGELKIESEPGEGTRITLTFNHNTSTVTPEEPDSSVIVQLPSKQIKL